MESGNVVNGQVSRNGTSWSGTRLPVQGRKVVCVTRLSDGRWKRAAAGADEIYDNQGWEKGENARLDWSWVTLEATVPSEVKYSEAQHGNRKAFEDTI